MNIQKHVIVRDRIFTIENFFSLEECAHYIEVSESIGFEAASVTTELGQTMYPELRNNSRVIVDDNQLAAAVWQRVKPFVPSPLCDRTAVGINERWRFYRYEREQRFKMHTDGCFQRSNGEVSQITLMIYLNQDAEGGETRFQLLDYPEIITVVPRTGMALFFLHRLPHEGAPVSNGRKYVLRSDIMYSALPSS